jgi:hypothetical protein
MPKSKSLVFLAGVATLAVAFASAPATADLIKDAATTALAQGFGAVPRLLTVQGAAGIEAACNTDSGGTLVQTCGATDATISGNGYINKLTGTATNAGAFTGQTINDGTVSPAGDTSKNNIVNLSSLGITNASQIRLLYNPSQTGANPQTDIVDITLKFYTAGNVLTTSLDGGCGSGCTNSSTDSLFYGDTGTNLGNGGVGFVLKLSDAEVTALNNACGANLVNCNLVTGESTIGLSNDGPDSYTLFSSALAVPAPVIGHGLFVLLAVGGVLFGGKLLERSKKHPSLGTGIPHATA